MLRIRNTMAAWIAPLLVLLAGGTQPALAQFVSPPQDLKTVLGHAGVPVRYKEVPTGVCELDPAVRSFAGYADVAEDRHIFWWFFEARNQDPAAAPLTVWINGGPGSTSMYGLFTELGPCGVDPHGRVFSNPHAWSNASNLLFVDQPSQVGFSYSRPVPAYQQDGDVIVLPDDTCPDYVPDKSTCGTYSYPNITLTANSTRAAAENFWQTLQGFTGAFPQYAQNGVNLATESYGGHYGPVFSAYIERQNAKSIPGAKPIDFRTLLIGNGWFDPILNYQAFYNFTVSPGNTYDYRPFNDSVEALLFNNLYGAGNCLDRLEDCRAGGADAVCQEADAFCADQVESIYDAYLGRDEYDIRELAPDPFPYMFFAAYLQQPAVQRAIGAFTNHSDNGVVWRAFRNTGDDAREVDTVEDVRYLLERNVTVAIYAGDADFNCNWLGNEAVAAAVDAPGFRHAGYTDLQTTTTGNDDDEAVVAVHGQVKQAGRFSFTRVFESGHMVPFYQPAAALALFRRAIGGRDIATGRAAAGPGYRTKGPAASTYRNGNATMQWHVVPANATYNVTTNRPGAPWPDWEGAELGAPDGVQDAQRVLGSDLGAQEL